MRTASQKKTMGENEDASRFFKLRHFRASLDGRGVLSVSLGVRCRGCARLGLFACLYVFSAAAAKDQKQKKTKPPSPQRPKCPKDKKKSVFLIIFSAGDGFSSDQRRAHQVPKTF